MPSEKEIQTALNFVSSTLNESMSFLRKSILSAFTSNNNKKESVKITKEETYRELNFVYHVVYGASCLLKRPTSNRHYITEQ
jgi:hypothetical protein